VALHKCCNILDVDVLECMSDCMNEGTGSDEESDSVI
jgi:hypothetical protein